MLLAGLLAFVPAGATDTGITGGGDPVGTLQPSLVVHCGLASAGAFPSPGSCGAGSGTMVGEIRLFAGSFIPAGFYPADGRLLPIAQNTALFSLLFTAYGGDGFSTFGIPDLRGRALGGVGGRPGLTTRALGEKFGSETGTLSLATLPFHGHAGPGGATGPTGGSVPISTLQPTLTVHPLICPYPPLDFYYVSEIRFFGGSREPGFTCDGRLLFVDAYPELYSVLGARYGGDGLVSFAIPDLRSEVAIGSGTGPGLPPRALGEYVGVESVALASAQLPGHTHGLFSGATGSTGSGQGFENHQPSLTLRWAVAMNGVYPNPDTPNDSDQPVIGEIRPFAGEGPLPGGWADAQGQLLSIASNTGLFFVLGNTFGGNGINTFALPDLRGRTPVCSGQGAGLTNRFRGELIGTPATTLTIAQLAPHAHVVDPTNTRRPGEPPQLRVGKNALDPSKIDLSFGVGCPSGATAFAVYQGTLGNFTSHALLGGACGITGSSLQAQTPCAGNCYYLVSAVDDVVGEEGSLGQTSTGLEIPRPAVACRPAVDLEGCVLNLR